MEVDNVLHARKNMAVRCAVYARVSSDKQRAAGNLDRQLERLRQATAERGYEVVIAIRERASGLNEKRKGLRRLFRLAANGEIDLVPVSLRTAWPVLASPMWSRPSMPTGCGWRWSTVLRP